MAKNKGKESTIGKIIYGFLMFAPLLAILTSCAYSIFNKNAIDIFTHEETKYTSTLVKGHTYTLNNEVLEPIETQTGMVLIENVVDIKTNVAAATTGYGYFFEIKTDGTINLSLGESLAYWGMKGSFTFTYRGNGETLPVSNYIKETIQYTENKDLRNTFYYSLEKIEEEPVFNWAKNNEIYTGIKNVCDTMSITNTFYPMILTYWLIISTIYFIYDIILIIFHILHNYIHKLEDI